MAAERYCRRAVFPAVRRLVFWLTVLLTATFGHARDAYVLLSGGGTPLMNNYSQYLQACAVAQHLRETYPADSVWTFFGQGNRPGEPVQLADVHRQVKEAGRLRESWVPGVLPGNRPASKEEFLAALRREILPAVHDGGTLYLFVGDHGALAKKDPKESVVTMWQMEHKAGDDRSWRTNPEQELTVSELRAVLADGLGQGRVVFCMTQCHSGGFHFLGVPREARPPSDWFSAVPEWAMPMDARPLPLAAGFTAVDEASLAAGCDPDPDPDRWAGYERFGPEAWLGVDLFSGKKTGPGVKSFAAAHEAAVLVDQTIDKPRSSSEQLLERWAALIEKLAGESNLTPETRVQVAAYQAAVNTGLAPGADPALGAKRALFDRFIARMMEQNQAVAALLQAGSRAELEKAVGPPAAANGNSRGEQAGGPNRPAAAPTERMTLWKETVRPAWKAAVAAKKVKELPKAAREFEQYLLAQEDKGRDFMFARGGQSPMLNDLFWQSGYAFPAKLDAGKAEAITRWGAERRQTILAWAEKSKDPAIHAAAGKLAPPRREGPAGAPAAPPPRTLSRKIAAERVLFYRRVLGAWAFLLAMKDEAALQQLQQITELENTPLPASKL